MLQWFRQRWQVEVTFEEVRSHLGVETQRQWSDARNFAHYSCSRRLILDYRDASQSNALLSIPLIYPILLGTASRPQPLPMP